jgi:hypothetical protein
MIKGLKGDSKWGEVEGGLRIKSFSRMLWFEWDLRSQCLLTEGGCPPDFFAFCDKNFERVSYLIS